MTTPSALTPARIRELLATDLVGAPWFDIDTDDRRAILTAALQAENFRAAYESKIQDLAKETLRSSAPNIGGFPDAGGVGESNR